MVRYFRTTCLVSDVALKLGILIGAESTKLVAVWAPTTLVPISYSTCACLSAVTGPYIVP